MNFGFRITLIAKILKKLLQVLLIFNMVQNKLYMNLGYIIQFYHPIEADLPEDIREDWMQMHHEELIRDNKVFENVQLKLDI
jgi:hypothetical protein